MKSLFRKMAILTIAGIIVSTASAEEKKGVQFNASGDFVSTYVWRGMYQNAQACVQPTLGIGIKGVTLTAWGSTSLADVTTGHKELDFTLAYGFNNFTIQIADLWWDGQGNNRYFHYGSHSTGHHFEAGISYVLPCEKFPLSIAWNTVFAGDDKQDFSDKHPHGKQAYSSYAELNYPFSVKGIDLNATLGFVPYKSQTSMGYDVTGFAVTNIALTATKEIQITKSFSVPLFVRVITNPAQEDTHLVLGFTIR